MNNITLLGRLGKNPEIKFFESGKSKVSFSIAVTRSFKDKDGKYGVDWFNCVCFGKTGEIIGDTFKKGDSIVVNGSIQNNKYLKDGSQRDFWEINVNNFSFCGKNKNDNDDLF